jgi:nitrogen fixation protein
LENNYVKALLHAAWTPEFEELPQSKKLIAVMAHYWFKSLSKRFDFPDNYTTLDLETDGLEPENNHICAIGHTVVRGRKIIETQETYLDWTRHPDIDTVELHRNLLHVQRVMTEKGNHFSHSFQKLKDEGFEPIKVLEEYLARFEAMEKTGEVLIAHNGWRFDIEFLQSHFYNFLGVDYVFAPELVYDSGICEKASQLQDFNLPLPDHDETMREWALRVGDIRIRGVRWALDGYCEEQYGLEQQLKDAGHVGTDHCAGYDSIKLHFLFEEHRRLAGLAEESGEDLNTVG